MPIDTDILSFSEYNSNCSDENTKLNQLSPLVLNSGLASSDTNKIVVRRSGVWSVEGQEAYNGQIQNFGNISGNVSLVLNDTSSRIAMLASITGNVFITEFSGILPGWVYHLYLKQDGIGGHTVRWPYGASILGMVGTEENQITDVYVIKLPNGKIFIKNKAFLPSVDLGSVVKELEPPTIISPEGASLLSFIWSKSTQISYGGILTDLYSDWEIAEDALYANLLFSSYGNTVDVYSIQVILTQEGAAYMRTRFGGNISGVAVESPWTESIVTFSGSGSGDRYWDQTVLCINADQYGWEGSRKIVDAKRWNVLGIYGETKITSSAGKWAINFDGSGDYINGGQNLFDMGTLDFTIEGYFSTEDISRTFQFIMAINTLGTAFNSIFVGIVAGGFFRFGFTNTSTGQEIAASSSASVIVNNTIHHFSLVRSGSNFNLYLDGSSVATGTTSVSAKSGCSLIIGGGADDYGTGSASLLGKIYSFRIIKNIARYDSDFSVDLAYPYFRTGNLWWTPEPKEIATDNFIDSENWDKTIFALDPSSGTMNNVFAGSPTVYGNSAIATANNLSYINFDGTGDYLSYAHNGHLDIGSKDFTIECFIYVNTNTLIPIFLIIANTSSNDNRLSFGYFDGYWQVFWRHTATVAHILGSTTSLTTGTIHHVAFVRASGVFKLFIDGVQQGADAPLAETAPVVNGLLYIGNARKSDTFANYLNGRIYGYRVSDFARYTSNFTIDLTMPYFPVKPKVENWAETSLLINSYNLPSTSTDIKDFKGGAVSLFGDVKVLVDSNELSYINFDGTGDYLSVPNISTLKPIISNNFTIEVFAVLGSTGRITLASNRPLSVSNGLTFYCSDQKLAFFFTGGIGLSGTSTLEVGTLYHLACVCSGGTLSLFVNGVKETVTVTGSGSTISNRSDFLIGNEITPNEFPFNGRMYGFRFTFGKALYSSNFKVDLTNPYFPAIDSISNFWLDGNDYARMGFATGLSSYKDKSFNEINPYQSSSGYQPALIQNAQNGLRGLGLSGSSMNLPLASTSTTHTLFICFNPKLSSQNGVNSYYFDSWTGRLVFSCPVGTADPRNKVGFYDGTWRLGANAISTPQILDWEVSGTTGKISRNGELISTLTYTPKSISGTTRIFSSSDTTPQNFGVGDFFEMILFTKQLSDYFKNKIRGFFAHKWNTLEYLPVDFLYKSSFPVEDVRIDNYWDSTILCIDARESMVPTEVVDTKQMNKIAMYGNAVVTIDSNYLACINFDGSSDYLTMPYRLDYQLTQNFTMEFFCSLSAIKEFNILACNRPSGTAYGYYFGLENGKICFACWNNLVVDSLVGTTIMDISTIYHAALTVDSGVVSLYVNGVLEATKIINPSSISAFVGPLYIGYNPDGNTSGGLSRHLNGKIYSSRITNIIRYNENFTVNTLNPYFPKK